MLNTSFKLVAVSLVASFAFFGSAFAENAGEVEYTANCATCHGAAGMGQGPLAELLTVEVPDLTTIAQRNDGVFPFLSVVHSVDGRTGLRGHGSNMPVWGDEFTLDQNGMKGDYSGILMARGRILSIVYYLESIQK